MSSRSMVPSVSVGLVVTLRTPAIHRPLTCAKFCSYDPFGSDSIPHCLHPRGGGESSDHTPPPPAFILPSPSHVLMLFEVIIRGLLQTIPIMMMPFSLMNDSLRGLRSYLFLSAVLPNSVGFIYHLCSPSNTTRNDNDSFYANTKSCKNYNFMCLFPSTRFFYFFYLLLPVE